MISSSDFRLCKTFPHRLSTLSKISYIAKTEALIKADLRMLIRIRLQYLCKQEMSLKQTYPKLPATY